MKTVTKILQEALRINPGRDYKEIGLAATPDYLGEFEQATYYTCKQLADTYQSLSADILLPESTRKKAQARANVIGEVIGILSETYTDGSVSDDIEAMNFTKDTESE